MNGEAFSARLKEAARQAGFDLGFYGKVGEISLPVLQRIHAEGAPEIYIAAGVHGNEPAPPLAVLDLLRKKALPPKANFTLFPLINPGGLAVGTRENPDGIDLNRDYGLQPRSYETRVQLEWIGTRQFDLTLCLHEDDDGEGFYVYSHGGKPGGPDYPGIAIEAARPFTGIDPRSRIDDMPSRDGRMFPPEDVLDRNRRDLPEALRLFFHHGAEVTITTETPSRQLITKRVDAQVAVTQAVITAFLNDR